MGAGSFHANISAHNSEAYLWKYVLENVPVFIKFRLETT